MVPVLAFAWFNMKTTKTLFLKSMENSLEIHCMNCAINECLTSGERGRLKVDNLKCLDMVSVMYMH